MKSERRHELEHNLLADWTTQASEKVKPYTNVLIGGAIAIVILAVAISLWTRQGTEKNVNAWNMYYVAQASQNPSVLQEVIDAYDGTEAAQWARACKGDTHLANGCGELFSDKANAGQELDEAIESYSAIATSENPFIKTRATFGLARAYESKGELDKAKDAYQKVTKQKDSPYIEIAQDRLTDLERPGTLAFYDRFAAYEPKPAFSAPTTELPSFESTTLPAPEEKVTEEKPVEEKEKE